MIIMNYDETIEYIHRTPKFSRELGNRMLKKLLGFLGNPQDELKFVHIAGTNGKGSTAVMINEILISAGYRTGLFTSPYIHRFNERIKVNNTEIPDEELAEIVTQIREKIENYDAPVSEFALDTAAAFCYFKKMNCDIVVLETGLGGRLDATNVINENLVTVITSIGLDHTQYLGDTIEKITAEKCGILKQGCPVVTTKNQDMKAKKVINENAEKMDLALYYTDDYEKTLKGARIGQKEYVLAMDGEFQAENGALAVKTAEILNKSGFSITDEDIRIGLENAVNIARFEWFGKNIILDGGHNPQGAEMLLNSLKKLNRNVYLCVAMMEDKEYVKVAEILSKISKKVVTTQIDMPRCASAKKLADVFESFKIDAVAVENPENAVDYAINDMGKEDVLCICGSLYLAGRIRNYLKNYIDK